MADVGEEGGGEGAALDLSLDCSDFIVVVVSYELSAPLH